MTTSFDYLWSECLNLVIQKCPVSCEIERLATAAQAMVHEEFRREFTLRNGNILPSNDWLCHATVLSALPPESVQSALKLLTKALATHSWSIEERDQFLVYISELTNTAMKEELLERILPKCEHVQQSSYWKLFKKTIGNSLNMLRSLVNYEDDEELAQRCCIFKESALAKMANWTYSGEVPKNYAGLRYQIDTGKTVALEREDVILVSGNDLLAVMCLETNECCMLHKISSSELAVIGVHPFAVAVIAYLKQIKLVPKCAEIIELDLDAMCRIVSGWVNVFTLGGWQKEIQWQCAHCASSCQGTTSDLVLTAGYKFRKYWGDMYLLECSQCKKTSVVLLAPCRQVKGRNLILKGQSFTVYGGPSMDTLKKDILRVRPKNILVSYEALK